MQEVMWVETTMIHTNITSRNVTIRFNGNAPEITGIHLDDVGEDAQDWVLLSSLEHFENGERLDELVEPEHVLHPHLLEVRALAAVVHSAQHKDLAERKARQHVNPQPEPCVFDEDFAMVRDEFAVGLVVVSAAAVYNYVDRKERIDYNLHSPCAVNLFYIEKGESERRDEGGVDHEESEEEGPEELELAVG